MTPSNLLVITIISITAFAFITLETNRYLTSFVRNSNTTSCHNWWLCMLVLSLAIISGTIAFPSFISSTAPLLFPSIYLSENLFYSIYLALILANITVASISGTLRIRYSLQINVLMSFFACFPILYLKNLGIIIDTQWYFIFLKIILFFFLGFIFKKIFQKMYPFYETNKNLFLFIIVSISVICIVFPFLNIYFSFKFLIFFLILSVLFAAVLFFVVLKSFQTEFFRLVIMFFAIFTIAAMDSFSYFSIPFSLLSHHKKVGNSFFLVNFTLILACFAIIRVLFLWNQAHKKIFSHDENGNEVGISEKLKRNKTTVPNEVQLFPAVLTLYIACLAKTPIPIFAVMLLYSANYWFSSYRKSDITLTHCLISGFVTFAVSFFYMFLLLWVGNFMAAVLILISLICILIYLVIKREGKQNNQNTLNILDIQPITKKKIRNQALKYINLLNIFYAEMFTAISKSNTDTLKEIQKKLKKHQRRITLLRENYDLWKNYKKEINNTIFNDVVQIISSLQEFQVCLNLITRISLKYLRKHKLQPEQNKELHQLRVSLNSFLNLIIIKIEAYNYSDFSAINNKETDVIRIIELCKIQQSERFRNGVVKIKNNLYYLNILSEIKNIIFQQITIYNALRNLYSIKEKKQLTSDKINPTKA